MAHEDMPPDANAAESFDAVRQALAALDQACNDLAEAIGATEPPQRAFELASEIGVIMTEQMRAKASWAAELRTRMVNRIWKDEELSLAHLAKRIGVSKARADQITRAAQAAEARED